MISSNPTKTLKDIFPHTLKGRWQPRADHMLTHVIRLQSSAALRLTPVFFWRYLAGEAAVDPVYREPTKRKYADPIVALFHLGHGAAVKKLETTGTEDEVVHNFRVDLAETIRLGEIFETEDAELGYHFYLPAPNDLYQWNDSIYEIADAAAADHYKLVDRFVTWAGKADLYRSDSTNPIQALARDPEKEIDHPLWLR